MEIRILSFVLSSLPFNINQERGAVTYMGRQRAPTCGLQEPANGARRGHPFRNSNFSLFPDQISKNFRTRPNASERIWMHPDVSKRIRTGPNRSEPLRKLRKTCKHFKKFTNDSKNSRKNFIFFGVVVVVLLSEDSLWQYIARRGAVDRQR